MSSLYQNLEFSYIWPNSFKYGSISKLLAKNVKIFFCKLAKNDLEAGIKNESEKKQGYNSFKG